MIFKNELHGSTDVVQEMFFGSQDGMRLQKNLKMALRELDDRPDIAARISRSRTFYNKSLVPKIIAVTNAFFEELFVSAVYKITVTVTYSNGAGLGVGGDVDTYMSSCCGIKGNYVYTFKLIYKNFGGQISEFKEYDINKFDYPKDVIAFIIKKMDSRQKLRMLYNGFKLDPIGNGRYDYIKTLSAEVTKYVNSKYKGKYTVKTNVGTDTCKIIPTSSIGESGIYYGLDSSYGGYLESDSAMDVFSSLITEAANSKITKDDLSKSGSYISTLWKRDIDDLIAKGKTKKISNYLYGMYFAVVGNSFGDELPKLMKGDTSIIYKPKYAAFWKLCKQSGYLNDKHKAKILKDVDKTLVSIDKTLDRFDKEKDASIIRYYEDYRKDLYHLK